MNTKKKEHSVFIIAMYCNRNQICSKNIAGIRT